jgi:hypothetical protein
MERCFLNFRKKKDYYMDALRSVWEKFYIAIHLHLLKEAGTPIEVPQKK